MSILEAARAIQPHLVELRRDFHEHPEISYMEKETSARVAAELEAIGGYTVTTGVNGYGILADLQGSQPGPKVALRADMDALQIDEETGLPFASKNVGVMHACGHDAHITMLLGAARLLAQHKDQIKGSVRLIFQPAEERSPTGGAQGMIEQGALDGVDAVFGMHVWPDLPMGVFSTKAGPLMAASDHFSIKIKGESCHGAQPHLGSDAVVAGSEFVTTLQSIISRNADPMKSAVITVGRFHSGTRYNIVSGECELEGTCRTFDVDVRDMVERRIREVLAGVCMASGCSYELKYDRGYCAVNNDPAKARYVQETAEKLFGQEGFIPAAPSTCAEDFAFYLTKKPGAFLWLGTTAAGEPYWPLHNCHYAPNEEVLWRGAALMTQMVLDMQ